MIIYGKQVFFYALKHHQKKIEKIYLAKECDKQSFTIISRSNLKINRLDFKAAQALARGGNHQGFLMHMQDFEFESLSEVKKGRNLALFCGISDVGNLGAMIRTAYALGFDGIIIVAKSVASEALIRTSSGAALDMKIALVNEPYDILNELKQLGFRLISADMSGKPLHKANLKASKRVLIMGSEGQGLSKKILAKSDEVLQIAMKRDFDSLNVSASFAIFCDRIMNDE